MKIKQQTETQMLIKNNPYSQLVFSAAFSVVGIMALLGFMSNDMRVRLAFGGIFMVCGLLGFLFTKFKNIVIDKPSNSLKIDAFSILGKKNMVINIREIERIEIYEATYTSASGGGGSTSRKYTSTIRLKNGDELLLSKENPVSNNMGGLGFWFAKSKDRAVDSRIASFIGVPFVQKDAPTLNEVIGAVKKAMYKPESVVLTQGQTAYQVPSAVALKSQMTGSMPPSKSTVISAQTHLFRNKSPEDITD